MAEPNCPTSASQAESAVLGAVLELDGAALPPFMARLIENAPESFSDPRYGQLAVAIRAQRRNGQPVNVVALARALPPGMSDGHLLLSTLPDQALPPALAESEAEGLWQGYQHRQAAHVLAEGLQAITDHPDQAGYFIEHTRDSLDDLADGERSLSILSVLKEREFNASIEPPPLRPIYTLAANVISTPGNLTTITSAVKTGKSAVIGAKMASALPHTPDADLLGFASENPKELALLLFDSEQSPEDFWHCVSRALRRAGLREKPPWLHCYCLTGLGCKRGWEAVREAIHIATGEHPGIHSILFDGAADFVADVNDAGESNAFVAEVHDLAIKNDCPIVGVIHFNPGSEKTRGHLGSQLERKAETNLRLDKEDGITTIWSDKQRRAPIPKELGPRFQWSDTAQMHVSVANKLLSKVELETRDLRDLAEDVFRDRGALRYTELIDVLAQKLHVSTETANRRVKRMRSLTVIRKTVAGLYEFSTPA